MIPFLDLKAINSQYKNELLKACERVIDSGWYIHGSECKAFEDEFAKFCGSKFCSPTSNSQSLKYLSSCYMGCCLIHESLNKDY